MNWGATIANGLWTVSNVPAHYRFCSALNDPEVVQLKLLRRYITANAETAFGHAHDLSGITNYKEFSERVPIIEYEHLEPWVARIVRGETDVLTREPIIRLVPTSGSTAGRKLIPFTKSLQREFNAAIGPWITDIYSQHPRTAFGSSYWSITPAAEHSFQESRVPIGFAEDSSYLGGVRKNLVNAVMAAPNALQQVTDIRLFVYLTLLSLVRCADLRIASVWHPSFLSLLLDALPAHWNDLLADIRTGRSQRTETLPTSLRAIFNRRPDARRSDQLTRADPRQPETIWPLLQFISCWGDAHAEGGLADVRRRFPNALIQAKGLLATEAFVTIPFRSFYPVAIRSHFFEFLGQDGKTYLTHELREGNIYEVIVTTGGGLWRYRLRDSVQVRGFLGKTPSLKFRGRVGNVSDRFGEKLSDAFVASAVDRAAKMAGAKLRFALLAPETVENAWHYTLFAEGDAGQSLTKALETLLSENPHYAWCRKLGQLHPVRIRRVINGYDSFICREVSRGKRLGDIKPCALSIDADWADYLVKASDRE